MYVQWKCTKKKLAENFQNINWILTTLHNGTWYEFFSGYGSPGTKTCRNSCRNPGYGNFPGYGIYVYIQARSADFAHF